MWRKYNPNPCGRSVGDCAVRAVSVALGVSWEEAYIMIADAGLKMCDMPSSDSVWGAVLRQNGFYRANISNAMPDDYTAAEFAEDHPRGVYVLGFGGHTAAIKDGILLDNWDSSGCIPQFYWYRKER